ncbi:hypothetical protein [Pedobacter sp. JCM 36344]
MDSKLGTLYLGGVSLKMKKYRSAIKTNIKMEELLFPLRVVNYDDE